jgi:coproporphyrinogen III oxidase-like Fe-S oxidoreductase
MTPEEFDAQARRDLLTHTAAMNDWITEGAVAERLRPIVDQLVTDGLMERDGDRLRLTDAGRRTAEQIQREG